jgi:hypothetical protein
VDESVSQRTAAIQLCVVAVISWQLRAGTVREPRGRETSAVGNRYQATASEDCNRLR